MAGTGTQAQCRPDYRLWLSCCRTQQPNPVPPPDKLYARKGWPDSDALQHDVDPAAPLDRDGTIVKKSGVVHESRTGAEVLPSLSCTSNSTDYDEGIDPYCMDAQYNWRN